ncbi:MAG: hypothetical protein JSV07_08270 [Acidimicrobiia bacterium]|nr:MAG: hypothetical protein JSV07_08270 [Acidimicrobiia bacterium]
MDDAELLSFIKDTEDMIRPKDVGLLYQRAEMLRRLPLGLQRWIVSRASSGDPSIGFVVEPYAFFLSYEIIDLDWAQSQLPESYRIVPAAMFDDVEPRPCAILGAFNVHTSVFWGSRVEFYLIAEDTRSGMLSWVICDYESNTINYDPGEGFTGASTRHSVVTTSHRGEVIIDVGSGERNHHIDCVARLEGAPMRPLEQRLWIEGNLSVDYGGRLMNEESVPFGLVFDPEEVARALHVPLDAVDVGTNTFAEGRIAGAPREAACFPYAQHFRTSSFPVATPVHDRAALEAAFHEESRHAHGRWAT